MKNDPNVTAHEPHRGGIVWRDLNWPVIAALTVLHLMCLAVIWPAMFSWSGVVIALVLAWVSGGVGITLCFHRLLTHRSFKTPKWMEYFLALCGCLAWQGDPATWVGTHRLHHKHADTPHDPHSPDHGFTWSHILWTLHERIEGINGQSAAKDLLRDRGMNLIIRLYWIPQIALAGALFGVGALIGGWELGLSWIVWGIAIRTVFVYHATWFVNSAAHTWGYQNYEDTGDHSTNLWWVAVLSFGEGWHNNHHAHPRSAAHGLRWFELDTTWWLIRLMSWCGLAHDLHLPKPEQRPGAAATEPPDPQPETAEAPETAEPSKRSKLARGLTDSGSFLPPGVGKRRLPEGS